MYQTGFISKLFLQVNHQKVTWKSFSRLGGSGSVLKKSLSEPEFRNVNILCG